MDFTKPIANGPTTRGFDYYFGVDVPNYPPYCFIENDRTVGVPSLPAPLQKGGHQPARPDAARVEPHQHPARAYAAARCAMWRMPHRATGRSSSTSRSPRRITRSCPRAEFKGRSQAGDYGDFVAQVDGVVGEVLAALARTGLATNTLVIFTSDNGPECVEIDPGRLRAHPPLRPLEHGRLARRQARHLGGRSPRARSWRVGRATSLRARPAPRPSATWT